MDRNFEGADAEGFLHRHKVLICDRDTKFTSQFKRILSDSGVGVVLTPPRAPNCDACAERPVLLIKSECLGRMMFFGEGALKRAAREFGSHHNEQWPHQGDWERMEGGQAIVGDGEVECVSMARRSTWNTPIGPSPIFFWLLRGISG